MIERVFLLAAAVLIAAHVSAAEAGGSAKNALDIGYVDIKDDPRYRTDNAYAGIVYRPLGRPYPGAELGVEDARMLGRVTGTDFALHRKTVSSADELGSAAKTLLRENDAHFILADLPTPEILRLADAVHEEPVLIMNVSASEDALRGVECRRNVVHLYPSESMLSDTLVQYLVQKNWTDILVLQGPAPDDADKVAALARSAAKFGAEIVGKRSFVLGTDPRRREENNVAMVTAGIDADVVYVADSSGEFARYVPYATTKPRPVVGDAGLMPVAWHWSWYRHGAPQLQHRFEKLAMPRRMNSRAWAAWTAVHAVTQSAARTGSTDFRKIRAYMLGEDFAADGAKGRPMSFRPWDHQLRQAILLATADAVIAEAPLPEYLHQTNVLDTLGYDAPETACRF